MKTINKGIITAAILGASALVASAAQASDGVITINGQIASQTCTINAGTGPNVTVNLPTVQTTAFASAGAVAGRTGFELDLTNCTAPGATSTDPRVTATGTVAAFFEQGGTINNDNGALINTSVGGATNVNIQLMNWDAGVGTAEAFDLRKSKTVTGTKTEQGATQVEIDNTGSATLRYAAQYLAVGGVPTPGAVTSSVIYALNYN